jgi:hypothetical protein
MLRKIALKALAGFVIIAGYCGSASAHDYHHYGDYYRHHTTDDHYRGIERRREQIDRYLARAEARAYEREMEYQRYLQRRRERKFEDVRYYDDDYRRYRVYRPYWVYKRYLVLRRPVGWYGYGCGCSDPFKVHVPGVH